MLQTASKANIPPAADHSIETRYPGFKGGICRRPIHYRHRWHRDLLLQAALDPSIDVMEPVEVEFSGCLAFAVQKALNRVLVVGINDASIRLEIECELPVVYVARMTVLAEPIASDARAVWATRHRPIAVSDRVRILAAFEQADRHTLCDLAACVRAPTDGIDVVLGMACSGELALSIADGIRPEMPVWRRPSPRLMDILGRL